MLLCAIHVDNVYDRKTMVGDCALCLLRCVYPPELPQSIMRSQLQRCSLGLVAIGRYRYQNFTKATSFHTSGFHLTLCHLHPQTISFRGPFWAAARLTNFVGKRRVAKPPEPEDEIGRSRECRLTASHMQ